MAVVRADRHSSLVWPRADRLHRWRWWLLLVAVLLVILAIGLLSFFGDSLLPG